MERIKVKELKEAIAKAKQTADPVQKDMLWRMEMTIKTCPAQYIRITKMYNEVEKIRKTDRCHSMTTDAVIATRF